MKPFEPEVTRLDDAARAGWLYYVAGNTQDEIARKLGISRQSAQRLVTLAVSERLIKMRLDHPIGRCRYLAEAIKQRFAIDYCEITPSDRENPSTTLGIAEAAASEMERWFLRPEPIVVGLGTGRTLRAAADRLPQMVCPQHRLVSRLGTIKPDGSATFYDVIIKISDTIRAPHYPMPLPVHARNLQEKQILLGLHAVQQVRELARAADVTFVGIGHLGERAAILEDEVISPQEYDELRKAGAIGEITGWAFDAQGALIDGPLNARVMSAPLDASQSQRFIGVGMGLLRRSAIRAALLGRLVNGLITDEATAEFLLG